MRPCLPARLPATCCTFAGILPGCLLGSSLPGCSAYQPIFTLHQP